MCVHFRFGPLCVVLEAFPGSLLSAFPYLPKLSVCIAPSPYAHRISLVRRYLACPSYSSSWLPEPSPSPGRTNLPLESLGFRCAGFPPASRYSHRHSRFHALHMPSRSYFCDHATIPYHLVSEIRSFGIRLSPGTISAHGHSTSELLRTLQRMAASEPTS